MVIVKVSGGIGNQLFQYVFGQYLRYKFNQEVAYDCNYLLSVDKYREKELDAIVPDIVYDNSCTISKYRGLKAHVLRLLYKISPKLHYLTENDQIPSSFNPMCTYFFKGYWQDIKYYNWLKENVPGFSLKSQIIPEELSSLYDAVRSSENTLSLHVRRGDYFLPKNIKTYGVCDASYYERALSIFYKQHSSPVKIYLFTDDPDWVRQNLSLDANVVLVPNYPVSQFAYIELMSLCKHHIISNSSFSWWGAVLNNKPEVSVICPQPWLLTTNKTIALDEWTKIDVRDKNT